MRGEVERRNREGPRHPTKKEEAEKTRKNHKTRKRMKGGERPYVFGCLCSGERKEQKHKEAYVHLEERDTDFAGKCSCLIPRLRRRGS